MRERDEQRNGARRQRPHARRRAPGDDERPRGFQPERMRQLWSDIDDARAKLGFGIEDAPPAASFRIGTAVACVTDTATAVATWARRLPTRVPSVVSAAVDAPRALVVAVTSVPTALAAIVTGAPDAIATVGRAFPRVVVSCLRAVPLVGRGVVAPRARR